MRYSFGDHFLDSALRELRHRGTPVAAEPQVFDLLLYLLRNRDRVVGSNELLEAIWEGRYVSDSTVRNRINAARRLVGDDGKRQSVIRTVPRRGLRFVAEVEESDPAGATGAVDGALPGREQIAADAGGSAGGCRDQRPVIAVLPFANLSGDPFQEHLGDGMCEDIITALARHRTLSVVARNSVFAFKGCAGDVCRTGSQLGADYVVEGSVRRAGSDIRVTAHLIRTETGRLIWADVFDRRVESLFDVQDAITHMIAASVEPQIGSAERSRVERKKPHSLRAWDLFQLGTMHLYKATLLDNREAQRLLRLAIEHDRQLAQAHAHLSYAILLSMLYFEVEPEVSRLAEAHEFARTAMELDDQDAMVRFVYGRALLARRDYAGALQEMEQAVALNPALAIAYCGVGDSLAYDGRYSESFPYFQQAIELSPHDPQRWAFHAYRALAHLFAGQFRLAADWARKAARIPNCHYWPYAHRVAALGQLGEEGELEPAVQALLAKRPGFNCRMARERLFYVRDPDQLDLYVTGLKKAGIRP